MALTGDNVVELVKALSWPILVLFVVFYLRSPLRKKLGEFEELNFKAGPGGIEASGKTAAALQMAAAAGAAAEKNRKPGEDARPIAEISEKVRDTVDVAFDSQGASRVAGQRILWVDDRPDNNLNERHALEAMGLRIDLATSTREALARLGKARYRLVITDMKRQDDPQAGLALLNEVGQRWQGLPVIFYSLSSGLFDEASAQGAVGATSSTEQLFALVLRSLGLEPPAHLLATKARKRGRR